MSKIIDINERKNFRTISLEEMKKEIDRMINSKYDDDVQMLTMSDMNEILDCLDNIVSSVKTIKSIIGIDSITDENDIKDLISALSK